MYNSIATKSNSVNDTNSNPVHLNNRYRPRAAGIGYGKSSGYASSRMYSPTVQSSLVRVR